MNNRRLYTLVLGALTALWLTSWSAFAAPPAQEITPTPTATVAPQTPTPVPALILDDDDDVRIVVIQGPVRAITSNSISIYNFNIRVQQNTPTLQVIQLGDVIRVSGEWRDDEDDDDDNDDNNSSNNTSNNSSNNTSSSGFLFSFDDDDDDDGITININVIEIVFINVSVVVQGDLVWRDPGDCSGIATWVTRETAGAYFARCIDRPANSGGGNSGGGGGGRGGDNDDDDDDDDDD